MCLYAVTCRPRVTAVSCLTGDRHYKCVKLDSEAALGGTEPNISMWPMSSRFVFLSLRPSAGTTRRCPAVTQLKGWTLRSWIYYLYCTTHKFLGHNLKPIIHMFILIYHNSLHKQPQVTELYTPIWHPWLSLYVACKSTLKMFLQMKWTLLPSVICTIGPWFDVYWKKSLWHAENTRSDQNTVDKIMWTHVKWLYVVK